MARHPMLCIVTPDAPTTLRPDTARQLDKALRSTGCVHFATLALLPGPPLPEASAGPSLMFEIVVDDGIDPRKAIEMVLDAGFLPLWHLYRHAWPGAADAGASARRGWLREYLLAHTEPAACGFIGARDRSVAQILAEARLLEDARQKLQELRALAGDPPRGRDELAQEVLRWATNAHGSLLVEPAPRSMWRRGALPAWARWPLLALRLVVPALALIALLGWLGLLVAWLGHVLTWLLDAAVPLSWLPPAARTGTHELAIPGLTALVVAGLLLVLAPLTRSLEALPVMLGLAATAALSMLVLLTVMLLQRDWQPFWCGMQLVVAGLGAAASLGAAAAAVMALATLHLLRVPPHFAWLAVSGVALLAAAIAWLFALLAQGQFEGLMCSSVAWCNATRLSVGEQMGWVLAAAVPVAALVAGLPLVLPALQRAAAAWFESKDLPPHRHQAPPHQVHHAIDACEAALTGRQSHMISLTEVCPPTRWHGTWLRLSLWAVNQLADVYFTDGRLGAADGIKFGHWRLIDGGRRLLFCSNYDGSFGGYLDEFIRGASQGANLIWRGTELRKRSPAAPGQPGVQHPQRFPPTRALILRGCKYEQAFKAYARASMVPYLHRFEAYNLSLQDIERATRLRDALCLPHHPSKMDQILRALES